MFKRIFKTFKIKRLYSGSLSEIPLWDPSLRSLSEIPLWDPSLGSLFFEVPP
jgi:hypothetical protein